MNIVLGDMNCHHLLWDEARNHHLFSKRGLKQAEMLIWLMTAQDWAMALPHGMPMLEACNSKNLTRPDNVFCSSDCIDRFILCEARPHERPPRTDHFPIISTLDITPETYEAEPKPDFRKVDWPKFCKALIASLDPIEIEGKVATIDEFDRRLEQLDKVILLVTAAQVPMPKPSPRSKHWWTEDLNQQRKEVLKLGKKAWKNKWKGDKVLKKNHSRARRNYGSSLQQQKTSHWFDFTSNITSTSSDLWKAGKFVSGGPSDGCQTHVPTLTVTQPDGAMRRTSSNADKAKAFRDTFFPAPQLEQQVPLSSQSSRLSFPSSSSPSVS